MDSDGLSETQMHSERLIHTQKFRETQMETNIIDSKLSDELRKTLRYSDG